MAKPELAADVVGTKLRTKPLFASACAGMFVFGIVLAVLGTAFGLPEMRARLHVDLAQQGHLFLALYLGIFLSNFVAGPLLDSRGSKLVLLASALLVGIALAGFAGANSFRTAALAGFVLGFGGGGLNTCTNALVSDIYGEKDRASMLSLLGVFFGFGALFVPLLAASIMGRFTIPQLLLWSAALPWACAVVYAALAFPRGRRHGESSFLDTIRAIRYPGLGGLAVLLFFESGNEAVIGGWTSRYVGGMGLAPSVATLVLACYWASLMMGRVLAAPLLRRIAKPQMIAGSAVVAVVGCVLLVAGTSAPWYVAATIIMGLSFAPIFTTALGMAGDRYPQSVGSVFAMLFAVSLAGGMLAPWGVGQISQHFEPAYGGAAVRLGMLVPLAGIACICAVSFGSLRARRTPAAPTILAEENTAGK